MTQPVGAVQRVKPGAALGGALLGILLLLPLYQVFAGGFNYWLHILMYTFMYIAMASSWDILGGYTGYISLGHNVFFAIGAYLSGILLNHYGLSPFVTAPLAGVAAFLLGGALGLITLRVRGPAFIISTIALSLVMFQLFDNWSFIGGSNGMSMPLPPFSAEMTKIPFYYGMLFLACLSLYLSARIRRSRLGLALRCIGQDEVKAEASGINTTLYKVVAFGLSTVCVAMAGSLWGYQLTYLRPTAFFDILISANLVLMCVLGGRGTVWGPAVGAVLVVAFQELFVAYLGSTELNLAGSGLVMLATLLLLPRGVVGTFLHRSRRPAPREQDDDAAKRAAFLG